VGDVYEIIYGHRRVEASRRAGRSQIPAIVESLDDSHSMMQAIIENLQREDLGPMDTARALQELKDISGLTSERVAQMLGMHSSTVSQFLKLLQEPLEIQELIATKIVVTDHNTNCDSYTAPAKITAGHVRLVRQSGLDEAARVEVLKKAAVEGLTAKQARTVADALKRAQTPRIREFIMNEPTANVPVIARAAQEVVKEERETAQKVQTAEQLWWDRQAGKGAKMFLQTIKDAKVDFQEAWLVVEREAIGPEHMPYIEKRLRKLGEYLVSLADELDARREAIVQ